MKRVPGFLLLFLVGLPAAPTNGAPLTDKPAVAPPAATIDVGSSEGPNAGSAPPTADEWAKVPRLTNTDGQAVGSSVPCDTFVLRGWVRLSCANLSVSREAASAFGAVWGVAGALDEVKATATLVGTERLASLMPDGVPTVRNMASSVDITFPIRRGSALLLEVSGARWAFEEYNGNFFTSIDPGFLVDISWALGEAKPTLIFSTAQ